MIPHYHWQTTRHDKYEAVRLLKKEINLQPEMKHRLILRAIKTEENPEIKTFIRFCNKKGML